MNGHFNKAVCYGDYTIHRCGLSCRKQQHFHCLYCTATILRKRDLKVHISCCHIKHTRTPPSPFSPVLQQDSDNSAWDPNLTVSIPTLSPKTLNQSLSPPTSASRSSSASFFNVPSCTIVDSSTKVVEGLPLRLRQIVLYMLPRDPLGPTCLEQPLKVASCRSTDHDGIGAEENHIKMKTQDHGYGCKLVNAEVKKLHITVQRGRSLPPVKRCSCCPSPQYHCPFCGPGFFKPTKLSKIKIHMTGHFNKAVFYGDYNIHRCGLSCRKQQHFHCLYCTATILRKRDLKVHLSVCHLKHRTVPPTSDQEPDSFSFGAKWP
ncbi:hypothetical protein CHARACLAT_012697 [Characodon lateralis]|uniref:C2H2-type domain-containing protein n=1 Tax=Characodon lateralis TaxID=208331 RepID=A0ABU7ET83_9TELE|nr:hypothetical protein [Characodon lateralis]